MRDVAHDFFQASPLMAGPLVALVIFATVFVLVSIRVMRTRRDAVDRAAHLVLEGEEVPDESK